MSNYHRGMIDMALTKSAQLANRIATRGVMDHLPSLMEEAGVSKSELIEITGINQPTIYALYRGDYKSSLSGDAMAAIAHALNVSLSTLTGC